MAPPLISRAKPIPLRFGVVTLGASADCRDFLSPQRHSLRIGATHRCRPLTLARIRVGNEWLCGIAHSQFRRFVARSVLMRGGSVVGTAGGGDFGPRA